VVVGDGEALAPHGPDCGSETIPGGVLCRGGEGLARESARGLKSGSGNFQAEGRKTGTNKRDEQLKQERGLPRVIRSGNGPEFLGEAFVQWLKQSGVAIQYIQPGKPNQNAFIERFNRTFREEVLDAHLFARLEDVREAAWWWMIEYDEERPHDSPGDLTPRKFSQKTT
jgi:transposase InsO family protein